MMDEEELAHIVIGKSIEIHKTLGPGLSKANYIQCLKSELNDENIQFESMVEQEVYYKDRILPDGNPIDFIIEDMRKDKVIKSSLETKIKIHSIEKYKSHFSDVDFSDFFICSEVDLNLDANKENNIKLIIIKEYDNKIQMLLSFNGSNIKKYIDCDIIKKYKTINDNSEYIDLIYDLTK